MEAKDGVIAGLKPGKIWIEMSTTDFQEVQRLGHKVAQTGAAPADCPFLVAVIVPPPATSPFWRAVNGRCSKKILPLLTVLGRRVLHSGSLGKRIENKGDDQLPGNGQFGHPL